MGQGLKIVVLSILVIGIMELGMLLHARDKVVLISGATSGIGLAAAQAFSKQGWKVWAGFHKSMPDSLKETDGIKFCHLDVTDDSTISATIAKILKEDGRIDVLINNAGYGLIGAEECVTIEEAQHVFDVNFFGALRLIQAVLPTMRKQLSGHIINISSCVGIYSYPGLGLYSASKFALEGLSESLAATVSPWNIKVSIVEPGFVKTSFGNNCLVGSRMSDEKMYKKLIQEIVRKLAVPQGQSCDDIAALLVQIALNQQPDLRYQTNAGIKGYIAEKLVDPTGNIANADNIRFVKRLVK